MWGRSRREMARGGMSDWGWKVKRFANWNKEGQHYSAAHFKRLFNCTTVWLNNTVETQRDVLKQETVETKWDQCEDVMPMRFIWKRRGKDWFKIAFGMSLFTQMEHLHVMPKSFWWIFQKLLHICFNSSSIHLIHFSNIYAAIHMYVYIYNTSFLLRNSQNTHTHPLLVWKKRKKRK